MLCRFASGISCRALDQLVENSCIFVFMLAEKEATRRRSRRHGLGKGEARFFVALKGRDGAEMLARDGAGANLVPGRRSGVRWTKSEEQTFTVTLQQTRK